MNGLSYEEFEKELVKEIEQKVKEDATINFKDLIVQNTIKSDGQSLRGLIIQEEGINISPSIYVEPYYESYLNEEKSIEGLSEEICNLYKATRRSESLNVNDILEKDYMLDNVIPALVSDEHIDMIDEKGFTYAEQGDFLVIYKLKIASMSNEDEGLASITLTDEILDKAGIEFEELNARAIQNCKNSAVCESLFSMIAGMVDIPEEMAPPMYVLTNTEKIQGATGMLNDDTLNVLCDQFDKTELYIIPSSVHECIVVPQNTMSIEDINAMIESVNENEVEPYERLSDKVHMYDKEAKQIYFIDDDMQKVVCFDFNEESPVLNRSINNSNMNKNM